MEAAVKAMGYSWICGTNSVDVKNIAYGEQSSCLGSAAAVQSENRQSWLTWWKHGRNKARCRGRLNRFNQLPNGKLTAPTLG